MSEQQNKRFIDKILNESVKVGKISFKCVDILFILIIWALAFAMRYRLFPIESADYTGFLKPWFSQIRELGAFESLGHNISNYTSPYMYIMSIVSNAGNEMYALKFVSVLFDYLGAIAVFLIIYEITTSVSRASIAMAVFLLSPAVVINGAYWCQCDIIYSTFVLFALLMFFKDKSRTAFILLGVAFSFKLQTLFIIPFFIIMWLKNKTVKIQHIIYIPITYILMHIPAWIAGRPIKEWLGVYFDQSSYYPWGTLNYPNLYTFFEEEIYKNHFKDEISGAGLFLTIIILGVIAYYFYNKQLELTNELLITLSLFTVMVVVFTLPHMHDRYGFLVDVLAVLYGVIIPRKFYITIGTMVISILIYMPYLIATDIFPMKNIAVFLLILIVLVGRNLYLLMVECQKDVNGK